MDAPGSNSDTVTAMALTDRGHARDRRALDADLIPRSIRGDEAASRALHAHYYPVASAFLRKLGTRPGDIEDACQDVFMQFFRYLPSFRGESQLQTWLFRVCVTQARRARRRQKLSDLVSVLLMRRIRADVIPPADKSDASMVERALGRMGDELRVTFVLFELEGHSGKEVAEILRCPEATIWRRLYAARRIFRESLAAADPDAEAGA